ncbi:hypothetical protein BEWA_022020 [Theileria equi strain WA]|uniref:Uncharacterized protein n=1 Tax=Theileria equi strain WA TaxID=1537102 RepID=L0AWS8_THEEQ|nr:hypothetical protein BEWA_022020 [Theileria equi strain WA]AFZ79354.1 hypothetical protein BEWA_022020 [Theileria equi strain WA]|eukprot:XP_004829020.1 hypothetical protein BEWA_022020 [Theileria equi strain WA]
MDGETDIFSRLGSKFATALGEVGNQLRQHAKQATREIGFSIDTLQSPFCGNPGDVQCSLFSFIGTNSSKSTNINISGTYTFDFDVRFHPKEIGLIVVSLGRVDRSDFKFAWKRCLKSYETPLDNVDGCEYRLNADDVGATIVVTCSNFTTGEVAVAEIGPVDIDVRSKRLIQDALFNNTSRHPLYLQAVHDSAKTDIQYAEQRGNGSNRYLLYILLEELMVQPEEMTSLSSNDPRVYRSRFSSSYPRVRLDPGNDLVFFIKMNENVELEFKVYSRQQRDLIVLMVRVFHSRTLLLNSFEYNSLELTRDGRLDTVVNNKNFNMNAMLQKLNNELSVAIEDNNRLKRELHQSKQEKTFLELEIKSTIQVFQQQIAGDAKDITCTELSGPNVTRSSEISRQTTNASGVTSADIEEMSTYNKDQSEDVYVELINRNAMLVEQVSRLSAENANLQAEIDTVTSEKNRLQKHSQCVLQDFEKLKNENLELTKTMGELKKKIRKLTLVT